jgi:putative transposase
MSLNSFSRILDKWAYDNRVTLDFSRPGKPTVNSFIESFNGSFMDECSNTHWFLSLNMRMKRLKTGPGITMSLDRIVLLTP